MRLLLSLVCSGALLSCAAAPPRPPPAGPSAEEPSRPPTFAHFFDYAPFAVGLRRDGAPFQGQATLRGESLERTLQFDGGKALLDLPLLEALDREPRVLLEVEGQELTLLSEGARGVLRCGLGVASLAALEPCEQSLPSAELSPDDCDAPGERAWQATHEEQQRRFEACYADTSPATTARLQKSPQVALTACPRLLALAGAAPRKDVLLALWPPCQNHFPQELRADTSRAYLLQELPKAIDAAKSGGTLHMQTFHTIYRDIAPAEAEEIRKLAVQRFAPVPEGKWLALRKSVSALSSAERTFHLCGHLDGIVRIQISGGYGRSIPSVGMPFVSYPAGPVMRRSLDPTAYERAQVQARVRLNLGKVPVEFAARCGAETLWFFGP
jgi:hypothetical protein